MSFQDRWAQFDPSRVPDPSWEIVWSLSCRAQIVGSGLQELENFLWRWRWTGWIHLLQEDPSTCPVCGGLLSAEGPAHGRRSSCSSACRQLRSRCHQQNRQTPWEQTCASARKERERLDAEAQLGLSWWKRYTILHPNCTLLPPDWTSFVSGGDCLV